MVAGDTPGGKHLGLTIFQAFGLMPLLTYCQRYICDSGVRTMNKYASSGAVFMVVGDTPGGKHPGLTKFQASGLPRHIYQFLAVRVVKNHGKRRGRTSHRVDCGGSLL